MALDEQRWAKPQEVSQVDMAFPASVGHLMPAYEDIPAEFKKSGNTWAQLQSEWFYKGLPLDTHVELYDGVDPKLAFRHLHCIQGSFEPKHEHKQAGVAYLMSRWFKQVKVAGVKYGG